MTARTRYIYVMDRGDAFKVGMAASPVDRVNQLRPRFGGRLDLVRVYDCGGWARWSEQETHAALSEYALGEEFFSASIETIHEVIVATGAKPCDIPAQSQKQHGIRMDDDLRARFDAAQKASGLPADEFVSRCLDALEHRNQPTNKELLDMLKERLK